MMRGPQTEPVSEALRATLRELSATHKGSELCEKLNISQSLLTRIKNGDAKRLSIRVLHDIHQALGTPKRASSTQEAMAATGTAMLAEARGDYREAGQMLSTIEPPQDIIANIAVHIARARAAAGQGDLEYADSLLAQAVTLAHRTSARLLTARAEFEWALIQGRRQKTGDAIAAYRRSEALLVALGQAAEPYLFLVRQGFLSLVLHAGFHEDAARLLGSGIEAARVIEPQGGLWQIEAALLEAIGDAAQGQSDLARYLPKLDETR